MKQDTKMPSRRSGGKHSDDFGVLLRAYARTYPRPTDIAQHPELFHAMLNSSLEGPVFYEPIYTKSGILAFEALARPKTEKESLSIQDISNQIHALGLECEFDTLMVANAIERATRFPLAVNISVKSAQTKAFWDAFIERFALLNPQNIIFEILEHDVLNTKANLNHLYAMKHMGYRFAIDDYALGDDHERRLETFGDLVSFIKIQGELLQDLYLSDPEKLKSLIKDLKRQYPKVKLIAEHVKHFDQAEILFNLGFEGVQGFNLREEEYKARKFHISPSTYRPQELN